MFVRMANNVREINHAQFADDTLLLRGASVQSANYFKQELEIYKQVSGSKINFQKSKIFSWNCSVRELGEIARVLEMEGTLDWDGFTYLGIPICKTALKSAKWSPILDKLKAKIQSWGANWLNIAGKTVLNSIPIYQSSILLAPGSVICKIESLLKKFIWEGGKGNERKLHLVSWGKIQKPRSEGGLQVRSIAKQNLAMGSKLVSGKESWSKEVLRKKYFLGSRLRCLDSQPPLRTGSPIYAMCLKALDLFKENLYWVPGNGRKIKVWEDSILGEAPLGHRRELNNIKLWLMEKGVTSLWDLSYWEDNNWAGWDLGDYPPELEEEAGLLVHFLQGKSPIKEGSKDRRGWGCNSGNYSASEGYRALQAIPYAAPNPIVWNFLWTKAFIPKIDMFCWTLAHKSILSSENLRKRGMEGPFRCPLCKTEEETTDHLMLGCPYSKVVWRESIALNFDLKLPDTIQELFSNRMSLSPF